MIYDFVRIGVAVLIFLLLFFILASITKRKGKSAVFSLSVAIIVFAVSLLVPAENYFYSFPSVEKAYSYRHHEKLITYVECDEGVVCIGSDTNNTYIWYTFEKSEDGYKMPQAVKSEVKFHSSKYGVYGIVKFRTQTMIVTQVKDSSFKGKAFEENEKGFYYTVLEEPFTNSGIECKGDKVTLI